MPKTTIELTTSLRETKDRIELWTSISDSWKKLTRRAEENLSSLDLSIPDFRILKTLDNSGPCPMARLSHETMLTQAAITVIVDELEDRRLVERLRSEHDRRVINIQITSKGRSVVKEALRMHRRFVEQMLEGLNDEELSNLKAMMNKLSSKSE